MKVYVLEITDTSEAYIVMYQCLAGANHAIGPWRSKEKAKKWGDEHFGKIGRPFEVLPVHWPDE